MKWPGRDPGGETIHGLARFRAVTEPAQQSPDAKGESFLSPLGERT